MTEPIRLVCPDCDTVHRVKRITLGKLYRCKKCRANLVTLTPASLVCDSCGTESRESHIDVSQVANCTSCADHPALTIRFPEPSKAADETTPEPPSQAQSPAIAQAEPVDLKLIVKEAVRETVGGAPGGQETLDEILTALTHVRELAASREDLAPLLEAVPVIMSYQESIASVSARSEQIQNALKQIPTSNETSQQLEKVAAELRQLSTQAKQQGLDQLSDRLEGVTQAIAATRDEQATKSILKQLSMELEKSVDQLAALGDAQEKRLSEILLARLGDLESRLDALSLGSDSAETDKILTALKQIADKPHDPRIDDLLAQTTKVIESIAGNRIDDLAKTSGEILEIIRQPLPVKADSRIDMLLTHTTELRQILDSLSDLPQFGMLSSMLEELSRQVAAQSDVSVLADQLTQLSDSIPADNSEKIIKKTASLIGQIEKTIGNAISAALDKIALDAAEKENLLSQSMLNVINESLERHHQEVAGQLRDSGQQQAEKLRETLSLTLSDKLDLVLATLSQQPIQSESDPRFDQMAQELVTRLEPHLESIFARVQTEETTRGFASLREEILKTRSTLEPEDLNRLESQIEKLVARDHPGDLAEKIGQNVSEEIGSEVSEKVTIVMAQQLADLPAKLEAGIVEPLAAKLQEKAPEILAEAEDGKFALQVETAARRIQEPLLEEVCRAGQLIPAWLVMALFVPIAFALGFVILKPDDDSTQKDFVQDLQSIDLQLQQIEKIAAGNARAADDMELKNLQEKFEQVTRTNNKLRELTKRHMQNAEDWTKRAKKLELKLRQLGYDPDIKR